MVNVAGSMQNEMRIGEDDPSGVNDTIQGQCKVVSHNTHLTALA
jgi:hypothetical protein